MSASVKSGYHPLHNGIVALARLVILHALDKLLLALARQCRIRRNSFTACAMTSGAGGGLGLARLNVTGGLGSRDPE